MWRWVKRSERADKVHDLEAQSPRMRILLGLPTAGIAVVILLSVFGVIPHEDRWPAPRRRRGPLAVA